MDPQQLTQDRRAAWCIGLPAILFIAVILHHPVLGVDRNASVDQVLAGISRLAAVNAAFHALVLSLLSLQAIGLWSFVERLGLDRITVRAGTFFYATSTILLFVAGIVDGFVTPTIGLGCKGAPETCAALVATAISIESGWIQAFTKTGLALQAISIACWAATLAREWRGAWRLVGWLGLPVASLPLIQLLSSDVVISPGRLASLIASACACTFGVAVFLWTGAAASGRPPLAAGSQNSSSGPTRAG